MDVVELSRQDIRALWLQYDVGRGTPVACLWRCITMLPVPCWNDHLPAVGLLRNCAGVLTDQQWSTGGTAWKCLTVRRSSYCESRGSAYRAVLRRLVRRTGVITWQYRSDCVAPPE